MTWNSANAGLTATYVDELAVSGSTLFAGTMIGGGVFFSTDMGENWAAVNTGLENRYVQEVLVDGPTLFVGTWGSGVWKRPLGEIVTGAEALSQTYP